MRNRSVNVSAPEEDEAELDETFAAPFKTDVMLSCKEAAQRMSEAQDRNLSLSEKLQLKMHLAMCGGCSNFGKQLDFLRSACKRYTEKPVQDENSNARDNPP
ncbi:zf-HC2 domain-containing protein [Sulfuritalea sp.]|uniref:zf-HC2 domain-containing protein n=1 Tax=Sulfuritalea sp. TaxID=2480090 RepID=UPI00286DD16D|nr:zf-HC2 domain-containing protein [Sulfuritalea sp.]